MRSDESSTKRGDFRLNPYLWLDFGEGYASRIDIPHWVPDLVADRMFLLSRRVGKWQGTQEWLARIANDKNLKAVWDEIFRKRRRNYKPTDAYLHPVSMSSKRLLKEYQENFVYPVSCLREELRDVDADRLAAQNKIAGDVDADQIQQMGALYLFERLFEYVEDVWRPSVMTVKEFEIKKAEFTSLVESLKHSGERLSKFTYLNRKDTQTLERISKECEESLAHFSFGKVVLSRQKGDLQFRGCVVHFAAITKELFGKHLNGTVQTIIQFIWPDQDLNGVNAIIKNHFEKAANS